MAAGAAVSSCWDCVKQTVAFCCARARYFVDLKDDIRDLDNKISQLNGKQEHVETRIQSEMSPDMEQMHKVTSWLDRVNQLKEDVDKIRLEAEEEDRDKNLRFFCPKNCCYFDRVGNRVRKKLQELDKLIEEGNFEHVVEIKHRALVVERKMEKTVGLESKFDEVRGYMEDTETGVIGLLGMGGVGKTTLLKMINNSFFEACKKGYRGKIGHSSKNDFSFDLVIWVKVSKEGGVGTVQEAIFKKLGIPEKDWKDKNGSERAEEIWRLLRGYKFALLLDDLWEQTDDNDQLDLSRVGVPADCNINGSKVVFTTRYENMCRVIRADRTIRVGCLPPNKALELFRYCVGEATLNARHEIPQLAELVVEACVGLPLALVIMGQAMRGKIDPREWERVIRKLPRSSVRNDSPWSLVMEDGVFPVLKVSYENLDGDILRTCFLYFSVFVEVHNLTKEELIELWTTEGFLTDHNGVDHVWEEGEKLLAKKKKMGEVIIQSLKDACLLESGESTNSITMHDITHAMTLWLAREEGKTENNVVVQKGEIDFAKWNDAQRLSLCGPGIDCVSQMPSCHQLTTLMVRATKLKTFPTNLFPAMPGLRVLNLSDNEDLADVPEDIGQLKNLLYLNLSGTSIKVLPPEFRDLTCLEVLLLDNTLCLETISSEVIGGLYSLQVFSRTLKWQQRLVCAEGSILDGLEMLEHVYEIRITLSSTDSIQRLQNSPKLRKCVKLLIVWVHTDVFSVAPTKLPLARMEYLKKLELRDCGFFPKIQFVEEELQVSDNIARNFIGQDCFINLTHVDIEECGIENMSWLAYATKLQNLVCVNCWRVVEVVGDAVRDSFRNLMCLTLLGLPELKRISSCNLPFPCLRILHVYKCRKLRVLPFDSGSSKNLVEIRGESCWWKSLEWTSKAVEPVLSPMFCPFLQRAVLECDFQDDKRTRKVVKSVKSISGVQSVSADPRDQKLFVTGDFDVVELVEKIKKARDTKILYVGISPTTYNSRESNI